MSKENFYVYLATCAANGKRYVGITSTSIAERWRGHKNAAANGSTMRIARAIRKHGADNFRVEQIAVAPTWEAVCELERLLILRYETLGRKGYNATEGGKGALGYQFTDRQRGRQSAGKQRLFTDPKRHAQFLERQRDTKRERKADAEHIEAMRKFKADNPEQYAKLSARWKRAGRKRRADPVRYAEQQVYSRERYRRIKAEDPEEYAKVSARSRAYSRKITDDPILRARRCAKKKAEYRKIKAEDPERFARLWPRVKKPALATPATAAPAVQC